MAAGRHARAKQRSSIGLGWVLVATTAIALTAGALLADDLRVAQAAVVALALVAVLALTVTSARDRRVESGLREQLAARDRELHERGDQLRELHLSLERVHAFNAELSAEVNRLREQIDEWVAPVPDQPEPVYPSLHLPLVRAAFAEDLAPVVSFEPPLAPPEVPPDVTVDSGSDPLGGRRVLDLTASEIQALRRGA